MTVNRIVPDMPAEKYHSHPAISSSGLDQMAVSPMHFKYWRENPKPDTAALTFGSAFHTLLLEPEEFEKRVAVWSGAPRNTKAGKEEYAETLATSPGKLIIKQAEYKAMQDMAEAILAHPAARFILEGKGRVEASVFWQDKETGAECRCRPDWLRDDNLIVDLKTARTAKPEWFERHAYDYNYHKRAAFYRDGVEAVTGKLPGGYVFINVEKEPPYGVSVMDASGEAMLLGTEEYRRDLRLYAECLKNNHWPGYAEEVVEMHLPPWALKKLNEGVESHV